MPKAIVANRPILSIIKFPLKRTPAINASYVPVKVIAARKMSTPKRLCDRPQTYKTPVLANKLNVYMSGALY
jgi:hypothetical protein